MTFSITCGWLLDGLGGPPRGREWLDVARLMRPLDAEALWRELTVHLGEVLIESGACEVHAYISHGVMSPPAVERVSKSVMKSLVITDSIQPSEAVRSAPNIRIVPTAPLLAQATLNIWNGTSVSSLFDDTTLTPIYESMYSPG